LATVKVIAMPTNAWTDDRRKRVAATVLVAAVLFLAGALVYYLLAPISLPWQRSEAHLTVSADVAAGVVHAHGTTDLPDGARLDYSFVPHAEIRQGVIGARPASLPPGAVTIPAHQLGGDTQVEHGAFAFDADLHGWPQGAVVFTVTFAVGPQYPQPPQVVSRFGVDGEHLAGPQVFADFPGARNKMYVTTEVQLAPPAAAVTLVASPPIAPGQLQLSCGSPLAFPPGALSAPPGAEQADHPAAETLRQLLRGDVPPSRPGWRVVVLSDAHALFLLPGLPVEGVGYWNAEFENRGDGWSYVRSGQCELQPVFEGIEAASWELAPGENLRADTTTLNLLVSERSCSSGRSPEGRIVPAAVIYEPDSVIVIFGVKPLPGAQTCQSAPPAAVSLELREALGKRQLFDGSVFPADAKGRGS
jgi:hypothetical protein